MTKQTIFSISLLVIVIAGLTVFTIWSKKHPIAPVDTTPVVTEPGESKYLVTKEPQMISVAEDSFLVGISGSYPQFTQADAAFNAKISKIFTDEIASFKKIADENYKARLETEGDEFQKQFAESGGFTFQIKTDIVQSNDNVISAVVHYGGYSGGAHGYQNVITFNYDVKNKKEISITDFGTLKDFSDFARNELKTQFLDNGSYDPSLDSMMQAGTDPAMPENFQNFTFTNNAVTIYFGQYQVGPYALGEQMVTIPR